MSVYARLQWDGHVNDPQSDECVREEFPEEGIEESGPIESGYGLHFLITGNWDQPIYVPSKTLEDCLPRALDVVRKRYLTTLQFLNLEEQMEVIKRLEERIELFKKFVALHRRLEEEGKNPRIEVSY